MFAFAGGPCGGQAQLFGNGLHDETPQVCQFQYLAAGFAHLAKQAANQLRLGALLLPAFYFGLYRQLGDVVVPIARPLAFFLQQDFSDAKEIGFQSAG